MSSYVSSLPESFGMPDSYTQSSGGAPTESAKELWQKRKNFIKNSSLQDDVSEYRVEHLMDASVDRKNGILTIDDCIRKMKILDSRGKIWSQEMCLRVDANSVKFVDPQNNEELETFPIQSVQVVKAVQGDDDSKFRSLCGFIVKHSDQKVPDIHLLHCPDIPAQIITADISSAVTDSKSKKAPKSRPQTMRQNREQIAEMYRENVDVKERINDWNQIVRINQDDYPHFDKQHDPTSPRDSLPIEEESPEVEAYKIRREVEILNHSLDDIEHFVSTIKRSAAAAQELTYRKSSKSSKSSKKSQRKDNKGSKNSKGGSKSERGMGILQLRSRMPPPEHYREIFQKFKFSFNWMSKLKKHLEQPNSVELVHFLFKPLEIVMASCEDKSLASKVMTPTLSPETIEFLSNCCTSHEIQVLNDLGKFWNLPRSEFPTDLFFPPYYPRFRNGWQPPPPVKGNGIPPNGMNVYMASRQKPRKESIETKENDSRSASSGIQNGFDHVIPPPNPQPKNQSRRNGSMTTSPEAYKDFVTRHIKRNQELNGVVPPQQQQQQQHISVAHPPVSVRKLCRSMHDFEARNKYELSVESEELLDVIDDSQSWWKVRNSYGQVGLVPGDLMLLISSATTQHHVDRPSSPPVAPYTPYIEPDTIPIPPPPPVPVAPIISPPRSPIEHPLKSQLKPVQTQPQVQPQMRQPMMGPKPIQPPKPISKPVVDPYKDRKPTDTSKRNVLYLQEELRQRVNAQRQRNFVIPSNPIRSNSIQLSGNSSPEQVKNWLRSHNFSPLTVESLGVLNGSEIFRMTKQDLVKVCEGEASRVYSQLLVQKSVGKTSNSIIDNELDEIMRKRKNELSSQGADQW